MYVPQAGFLPVGELFYVTSDQLCIRRRRYQGPLSLCVLGIYGLHDLHCDATLSGRPTAA